MATKKQARRAAALTVVTAAAVTLGHQQASLAASPTAAGDVAGVTSANATAQVALSTSAQAELARHGITVDLSSPAATIMGGTDPYRSMQWGNDAIKAPAANTASTGKDVIVAVLDSGTAKVADLTGKVLTGKDFVGTGDGTNDQNGHGTGVSSIIAATTGDGVGMAGIAPNVKILPVRVCDAAGACPVDAIAAGITWAVDKGAQVINMSLGGPSSTDAMTLAVKYAETKGVLVAAAVGNSAEKGNAVMYPGGYDTVEGVAAIDSAKARAPFSEYGAQVDIAAPGVNIVQAAPGGGYVSASGTSQASPHVAAVMALAKAYRPSITPAAMRALLASTATDLGATGRDNQFGAGLVDAAAVLTGLGAKLGTPTDTSSPTTPVTKAPTVTAISPASGGVAGGTTVTVTGTGFATLDLGAPSAVKFGSANAVSFAVVSDTKLTAVTPAGSAGKARVTVTNSAGASTGLIDFSYRGALGAWFESVSGVKLAGGTVIPVTVTDGTVGGTAKDFAAERITAKVGDNTAPVTWVDATHVKVTVPAATRAVAVPITLIRDGIVGTPSTSTVGYAPTVGALAPAKFSTVGGTPITITGAGFLDVDARDPAAVRFGTVNATSFAVKSATQIIAVAPVGTNGTTTISVRTAGGTGSTSATYRVPLGAQVPAGTVVKASGGPVILKVTGGTVGATAKDFAAEVITATAGATKVVPSWVDATHVSVQLPASAEASASVTLLHDGVIGTATTVSYVPVVVSLSPASGPVAGGSKVTVKVAGGDVAAATRFRFGDATASCTAQGKGTATAYVCVVPAAAKAGAISVSFTASTGANSRFTASSAFSYTDID